MVSLPSYAIAGHKPGDRRAAEASLKYVIYGGVASGIMLFGLSYIYGLTGTTSLEGLGAKLDALAMPAAEGSQAALRVALLVSVIFVLCGIGYKIAAVPWHLWCPDVYEGAPTPFTAISHAGYALMGLVAAPFPVCQALPTNSGAVHQISTASLVGGTGIELGRAKPKTIGAAPTCSGCAELQSLTFATEFRGEPCRGGVRGNVVAKLSTAPG